MTQPSRWEREAAKATSEVARRAIRRLDVLEWIILATTAVIAIGGGGLVALIVVGRSAASFRATWIATSLLLLIVPGAVVFDDGKVQLKGIGGLSSATTVASQPAAGVSRPPARRPSWSGPARARRASCRGW